MRSRVTTSVVPAARSDGLLVERVGNETVIYDTRSKAAHCLKPLAAVVFGCSDGHTTVGEIARIAEQRLGDAVSEGDVADAVNQLESLDLLQTALVVRAGGGLVASNGRGVSRRDMLRRVGFAGAAAAAGTSLVTSIVAPNAFAASGIPAGCSGCRTNPDCISGHCCQSNFGKSCNQSCCAGSRNSCHITSCVCSISRAPCPPGTICSGPVGDACTCSCSVCASESPGGVCATCPSGSSSCCDPAADCTIRPLLDDPPPP